MGRERLYEPYSITVERFDVCCNQEEQHHFFELIYVLSGRGKVYIKENAYIYRKGHMFLITPNDARRFEADATSELFFLRFNNIYIGSDAFHTDDVERLEFILMNADRNKGPILKNKIDKDLVKATVKTIIKEVVDKDLYNSELVQHLVNSLVILVANNVSKTLYDNVSEYTDGRIIEILNYIQTNIYDPQKLRIDVMSNYFNISSNYLGKYFKKHCNETLRSYISNCKLILLEKRLKHSDKRINEIVWEFGFTDESHLNKFFKLHHGISPKMYRNIADKT